MSKNDDKFTPEYSCKKAAELRDAMKVALPLVAEKAEMPLHLAEAYLSGEKVMSEKIYRRLQAVMLEAAKLAAADGEKELSPERWEELRAFCSTLRGPARVFDYKAEMKPFA